jgi:hypothetical protein
MRAPRGYNAEPGGKVKNNKRENKRTTPKKQQQPGKGVKKKTNTKKR